MDLSYNLYSALRNIFVYIFFFFFFVHARILFILVRIASEPLR